VNIDIEPGDEIREDNALVVLGYPVDRAGLGNLDGTIGGVSA